MKLPNAVPKPKRSGRKPSPLKKTRLKSRGKRTKKSGGALFPKSVRPEYRDFVRAQPCLLLARFLSDTEQPRRPRTFNAADFPGATPEAKIQAAIDAAAKAPLVVYVGNHLCTGRVQACHVTSRGAGGADVGNLYAGCAAAHHEQHAIGIPAFEARWGIDLRAEALRLQALYESEHPHE